MVYNKITLGSLCQIIASGSGMKIDFVVQGSEISVRPSVRPELTFTPVTCSLGSFLLLGSIRCPPTATCVVPPERGLRRGRRSELKVPVDRAGSRRDGSVYSDSVIFSNLTVFPISVLLEGSDAGEKGTLLRIRSSL